MGDPYPAVCDYEGSDYQETFWGRGGRAYEDRAEALALARLLPPGGRRLLEVGAGAGRHTPRYHGFDEVTLLDYSRSQLEQARKRLGDSPRYRYVVADVYRMPFAPAAFDAATMIRTLHHMADPASALACVRAALSPGAIFLLEYANKRNLKAILRWIARRQDWNPFRLDSVEFARLNYDFHPRAVRSWLQTAGFDLEREVPVSFLRLGTLKRAVPLSLLIAVEAALQRLGHWALVTPSIFVRSRAVGGESPDRGRLWRCPACGSLEVAEAEAGVDCRGCGRHWPRRDGIYEFRLPPATSPDPTPKL